MTSTIRIIALGDSTTAGTPAFLSPIEAPPDGRGDVHEPVRVLADESPSPSGRS